MHYFGRPKKLIAKIWVYLLLPTLLVLILISLGIALYFHSFSLKQSVTSASAETQGTALEFYDIWQYIIRRLISITVQEELREEIHGLLSEESSFFAEYNNALQDDFNAYIEIHEMISSVMLVRIDENGNFSHFYPYSFRLNDNPPPDRRADLSRIDGITFFPSTRSPFSGLGDSIPVVIPLECNSSSNYLLISSGAAETELLLYIFLDTDAVRNFLSIYCSDTSEGILYLAGPDGTPLSLKKDSEEQKRIQNHITSSVSSQIAGNTSHVYVNDCHVFCFPILKDELWLVNVIPESQFMQQYSYIHSILLTIGLTSLFFIIILSVMLFFFITSPLKKLMASLQSIEEGNYNGKIQINSNDEMEQLSSSIDSMYQTIQEQFRRIKQEETEKYNAQLQLLSEQINPHFLYNALEFINMEIILGHNGNASSMISSLGSYLRIGLAYGSNFLPFSSEVNHALAYVNIMNYRFSNQIQVTVQIPEELQKKQILKGILQPLVENSLKHGFRIGSASGFPFSPMITIAAVMTEEHLELSVTDNGAGIDVSRAKKAVMAQPETDFGKHVGLNNIYRRLKSYYGETDITFSSVPFFENRVCLVLPAHFFTGEDRSEGSDV